MDQGDPAYTALEGELDMEGNARVIDMIDMGAYESCTLAIDDHKTKYVTLFPNPAKDIVSIDGLVNSDCTINIINTLGEIVLNSNLSKINDSLNIDITGINSGFYILEVYNEYKSYTLKFLKL